MTGVRKLQEDEAWGIFLAMELQEGTLLSTYSFNRNLKNYYGPGTPVVRTCVGYRSAVTN